MSYFVEFRVPKLTGQTFRRSGPYITREIAEEHKRDIEGYEGVTDANVVYLASDSPIRSRFSTHRQTPAGHDSGDEDPNAWAVRYSDTVFRKEWYGVILVRGEPVR